MRTQMYGMFGVVLAICLSTLNFQTVEAVKCFECSDMPHPEDCEKITVCSRYQKCLVEQYVTSGGLILYNSGCVETTKCTNRKRATFMDVAENRRPIAKRQDLVTDTDIATCIQCCDGDFCNFEGCGTVAQPKGSRGTKCFECIAQADPESCRTIKTCQRGEVCAVLKSTHNLMEEAWETSCMREIQCEALAKVQAHNLIGKRATSVMNECPRCCTDDFCNHSCRHLVSYTPTTAMPAPTTAKPTTPKPTTAKPTTHAPTTTQKPTHAPTTTPKPTTHAPATKATTHAPITTHKPTHAPTTTHKPTHAPTTTHKPTHPPTTKATTHAPTTTEKATATSPTTIITTTTTPKPTTDPAVGCKKDGYVYNAHFRLCLKFYVNPLLNWTEAQNFCNSSKGQLAIITGQQKIDDVMALYKSGGYSTPLWVGATDLGNGHVFTFTDGSKLTVDPAEGHDLSEANCLYVNNGSYKGYGPCKEKHGFICERSSTIRE